MPLRWADLTTRLTLPAIGLLLTFVAFLGWYARRRHLRRLTPAELEKRRRQAINRDGKLGDGEIIDIGDSAVIYSYSVAGVGYTTSQDITGLETLLPADHIAVIGPVSVKFLTVTPGNSIVVCEDWSGLRNSHLISPKRG